MNRTLARRIAVSLPFWVVIAVVVARLLAPAPAENTIRPQLPNGAELVSILYTDGFTPEACSVSAIYDDGTEIKHPC